MIFVIVFYTPLSCTLYHYHALYKYLLDFFRTHGNEIEVGIDCPKCFHIGRSCDVVNKI